MSVSTCIALLCLLGLRLFRCLFVQHESRWRHVSFCLREHKLHNVEMSCLKACFMVVAEIAAITKFQHLCNYALGIHGVSQNRLVHFKFIYLLSSHFLTLGRMLWQGQL